MRRSLVSRSIPAFLAVMAVAVAVWGRPPQDGRVVPTGTAIRVRTNESIDSKTTHEGQTFSAVVEDDVVGSAGETAIPRGSDATLVIRRASRGNLILDLQSVTVGGRTYGLSSGDLQERNRRGGLGKNRRTAEMVGGGAALGTIIGAIAGHGKGAAIGALSGAAAGAAVQVLTRGKEVRVPAESVLTFRLNAPLRVES